MYETRYIYKFGRYEDKNQGFWISDNVTDEAQQVNVSVSGSENGRIPENRFTFCEGETSVKILASKPHLT